MDDLKKIARKEWHLPLFGKALRALGSFSITEKTLFYAAVVVLMSSALFFIWKVNQSFLVEIPHHGGSISEGIIGSPRFVNPLLATSDADRDLVSLIYSGLLKATPSGKLVPDLAKAFSISDDGLEYTFILRDNISFHDGTPITADDVIFTIEKAKDSNLKSPKRANFEGVNVLKVSDKEIKIVLKQAYSPFLENATLGILPKHIWKDADTEQFPFSEWNIEPIGSGPYKVSKISRNGSGVPMYYELRSFNKYALGEPYIDTLKLNFYANEESLLDALSSGTIESVNSISPEKALEFKSKGDRIEKTTLPRVFGVFFNQNQAPLFSNLEVRKALNLAVDKKKIVEEVLAGFGAPINGPIPPGMLRSLDENYIDRAIASSSDIERAQALLSSNGWKLNEKEGVLEKVVKKQSTLFKFSIATSNAPELKRVAELLKTEWEKLGAQVEIKVFDIGDLNQNIIRPRKYDALLFGEIIGRDLDLFAFWHSSQRNDPGLNIALYTNIKADKLLEGARTIGGNSERLQKYVDFEKEIENDVPAVFTYSPDFIYILPTRVQGFTIGHITIPSERFLNIEKWYIETDKVWKIFAPEQL